MLKRLERLIKISMTGMMLAPEPGERPEDRIRKKHGNHYRAARIYKGLYYGTRLVGGLCAGILPFVVYSIPGVATGLSVAIVVVTVLDMVFNPQEK